MFLIFFKILQFFRKSQQFLSIRAKNGKFRSVSVLIFSVLTGSVEVVGGEFGRILVSHRTTTNLP